MLALVGNPYNHTKFVEVRCGHIVTSGRFQRLRLV